MDVEIIRRVLRENVVGRLSDQACRAIQLTGVRPAELVISRDVLDNYLKQEKLDWFVASEPVLHMDIMGYSTWVIEGPKDLIAFKIK